MTTPIDYLMATLISVGCLAFIYGIYKACAISWPSGGTQYEIPVFLSSMVTSIAAVLSTNLGAVLGITIKNVPSEFRALSTWNPVNLLSDPTPSKFQTVACFIYILALLAAAIVWAHRNFTNETGKIVPLIPELTKSLLGVIVGVLAIALTK